MRESCIVTFDYGYGGGPNYWVRNTLHGYLARLGGFEKLVIKIVIGRYRASQRRLARRILRQSRAFPVPQNGSAPS